MNILVLAYHPYDNPIGGAFTYTNEILRRRKHKVIVYDSIPLIISEGDDIRGYKIPKYVYRMQSISFTFGRIVEWIYVSLKLSYELIKNGKRMDIIWIPYAEFIPLTITGLIGSIFFKQKLVCTIHNITLPYEYEYVNKLFGKFYHFYHLIFRIQIILLNRSNIVTTVSKYVFDKMKFYINKRIDIIHPGINLEDIENSKIEKNYYNAVYMGRLSNEKGIFELLDIWNTITKKYKKAKLGLIGTSTLRDKTKIDNFINENNLEKNIELLGPIYNNEKYVKLKSSNIFITLSTEESFPISTIEALGCRMPIIAYSIDGNIESVEKYEGVFLVEKNNKLKLLNIIEEIMASDIKYERNLKSMDWKFSCEKFWEIISKI